MKQHLLGFATLSALLLSNASTALAQYHEYTSGKPQIEVDLSVLDQVTAPTGSRRVYDPATHSSAPRAQAVIETPLPPQDVLMDAPQATAPATRRLLKPMPLSAPRVIEAPQVAAEVAAPIHAPQVAAPVVTAPQATAPVETAPVARRPYIPSVPAPTAANPTPTHIVRTPVPAPIAAAPVVAVPVAPVPVAPAPVAPVIAKPVISKPMASIPLVTKTVSVPPPAMAPAPIPAPVVAEPVIEAPLPIPQDTPAAEKMPVAEAMPSIDEDLTAPVDEREGTLEGLSSQEQEIDLPLPTDDTAESETTQETAQETVIAPEPQAPVTPATSATDDSVPTLADLTLSFDGASSDLNADTQKKLDDVIKQMISSVAGRLQVRAYATGEDGTASSARRVSLSRALSVRSYLMDHGIKPNRVDVRAMGTETDRSPLDRIDLVFAN